MLTSRKGSNTIHNLNCLISSFISRELHKPISHALTCIIKGKAWLIILLALLCTGSLIVYNSAAFNFTKRSEHILECSGLETAWQVVDYQISCWVINLSLLLQLQGILWKLRLGKLGGVHGCWWVLAMRKIEQQPALCAGALSKNWLSRAFET